MSDFTVTIVNDPRAMIVQLRGKLEYETVRDFERAAEELAAAKPARAVVDASELTFLNSAGIGVLIKLHRKMQEWGSELRVAGVRPDVLHMLKTCYVDRMLKLFASVDEALAD